MGCLSLLSTWNLMDENSTSLMEMLLLAFFLVRLRQCVVITFALDFTVQFALENMLPSIITTATIMVYLFQLSAVFVVPICRE